MKYIIANWKMNMDSKKIKEWFDIFNKKDTKVFENKIIVIAPSFPYLRETKELVNNANVVLGAQDVDSYDKGAHTGATGTFQIKEYCKYVIVGHSERKEQLETVLHKRDACITDGLYPIVCFTDPTIINTIETTEGLVAWEDPENISQNGVYRAKDPQDIQTYVQRICKSKQTATPLIYGGSVNRDNIKDLAKILEIDGVLVGNASLDPEHFYYIIENA